MEEEAHFLFVAYQPKALPIGLECGKEVHEHIPVIKRATIRKPQRETREWDGFTFSRVRIEFDPLGKQLGYVGVIHTRVDGPDYIQKKDVHFPFLTESETEAQELADKVKAGGFKEYLIKGQKFDRVEVAPILIAEY